MRRNYKAECIAILSHIKTQKEFNANVWSFDVYALSRTSYVKLISTNATDGENFDLFGDTRRTWKELADFLRAYTRGFWHGIKVGLEAENAHRFLIEIKTRPNVSGNVKRLYLEFDSEGYRQAVHSQLDTVAFRISDTLQVTPKEFAEYSVLAKK